MNPFQSLLEYEVFVYTLQSTYPFIIRSTLTVSRRGRGIAHLSGELLFNSGYRLTVYELLAWKAETVSIQQYGYEAWLGESKLYWYDSQPHPHDPTLASTHPHHKHVPPDIKHNRIPAPDLSFSSPNLPFLIGEIEQQLLNAAGTTSPDESLS